LTFALAGSDDAETSIDANAPRRLKIFSVNDGASPNRARERTVASFERSPAWSVSFLVFPAARARLRDDARRPASGHAREPPRMACRDPGVCARNTASTRGCRLRDPIRHPRTSDASPLPGKNAEYLTHCEDFSRHARPRSLRFFSSFARLFARPFGSVARD
jgi:hypothetical protein